MSGCRGERSAGQLKLCASLHLNSTLQIILLSWAMRSKMRRALGFASEAGESPDTQALLTSAEEEEENQEARNEARSYGRKTVGRARICAQGGQRP